MPYIERPGDEFANRFESNTASGGAQVVATITEAQRDQWIEVDSPVGEISDARWAQLVFKRDKRLTEIWKSALWQRIMAAWKTGWDYDRLNDLEHLCPNCGSPHVRHGSAVLWGDKDTMCQSCMYLDNFSMFMEASRRCKKVRGMWLTIRNAPPSRCAEAIREKIMHRFSAAVPTSIRDQGDGLFIVDWTSGATMLYQARIDALSKLGFIFVDSWVIATDSQSIAVRWAE